MLKFTSWIAHLTLLLLLGFGWSLQIDEFEGFDGNTEDNNITVGDIEDQEDDLTLSTMSWHATKYANLSQHAGELCNRECIAGDTRICYFKFFLEHYQAMGVACGACRRGVLEDCEHDQCIVGDGTEKGVMSINRMLPGPAIQVCKDDTIVVDVVNNAHGTAASIHWHGLHMRRTPFMDGVPFTTQCPIPFASTFRYKFFATEPGTQFYHSHSGHHKVNGQYGALIIRDVRNEIPAAHKYDYDLPEHYILISDYMHPYGEQLYPGLPSGEGIFPDSLLVNGRGVYINPRTLEYTNVPITKYFVKPGKTYRFRIIDSLSHSCPVQLQVEKHKMTIIASDSYDVEPSTFDTIILNAGERYDILIHTNHTEGDFWIRVRGLGVCTTNPTETFALLRYTSSEVTFKEQAPMPRYPQFNETYDTGVMINNPYASCYGKEDNYCITELNAIEEDTTLRTRSPDQRFFLSFINKPVKNKDVIHHGMYKHFMDLRSNLTLVGCINNKSLVFPSSPPLTQPSDVPESEYCDYNTWPRQCEGQTICSCVHRLKLTLNSIVEFVIVDESSIPGQIHHPFHIHGHKFLVTSLARLPGIPMTLKLAKQIEIKRGLPRTSRGDRPPFKDTVSIPSRGFAIVRFRTNNPGFWLLHCHYEWHLSVGMGLIIQSGKNSDMVPPPKGFPTCKNYLPPVELL